MIFYIVRVVHQRVQFHYRRQGAKVCILILYAVLFEFVIIVWNKQTLLVSKLFISGSLILLVLPSHEYRVVSVVSKVKNFQFLSSFAVSCTCVFFCPTLYDAFYECSLCNELIVVYDFTLLHVLIRVTKKVSFGWLVILLILRCSAIYKPVSRFMKFQKYYLSYRKL
jgi:hypothetical protein